MIPRSGQTPIASTLSASSASRNWLSAFIVLALSARQCLGQRFASLMVKLVVAHVVSKYQLRAHAPGVDSTSTSYSMNSSSWKMSMRDVKKDGLPYLTAYSCFPVLHCQPAGELALTSAPLSEPIFRTGLERVVSGSGIGVLGMSLGNSFFSRRTISLFIPFLLRFLPQLWIFIPDVPAECTYAAMGYSSREVKQKTRYNAKPLPHLDQKDHRLP